MKKGFQTVATSVQRVAKKGFVILIDGKEMEPDTTSNRAVFRSFLTELIDTSRFKGTWPDPDELLVEINLTTKGEVNGLDDSKNLIVPINDRNDGYVHLAFEFKVSSVAPAYDVFVRNRYETIKMRKEDTVYNYSKVTSSACSESDERPLRIFKGVTRFASDSYSSVWLPSVIRENIQNVLWTTAVAIYYQGRSNQRSFRLDDIKRKSFDELEKYDYVAWVSSSRLKKEIEINDWLESIDLSSFKVCGGVRWSRDDNATYFIEKR